MRAAFLIAAPAMLMAAPAFATGGFECRTTDGSDIEIDAVVGHGIGNPLLGATLRIGDGALSTLGDNPRIAVAQSWIDSREIRLDLVNVPTTGYVAQLRVRILTRTGASGTLRRDGLTHPVRCEVE